MVKNFNITSSYYYDFLKQKCNDPFYIDCIKFELDCRIYYYGNHFLHSYESQTDYSARSILRNIYKKLSFEKNLTIADNTVISNAYFNLNNHLNLLGYTTSLPPWQVLEKYQEYQEYVKSTPFSRLITQDAISKFYDIYTSLKEFYSNTKIKALCVSNDLTMYDKISIQIFKDLGKPSFLFLHGFPGRYNIFDENRTNYLIVWGNKIKEKYIQIGFDQKKIFISGHPLYGSYKPPALKFGLDDILVLSTSLNGAQHSDKQRLSDRGHLILHLMKIESALKSIGIFSVRLRVHPSEDINWYLKFLDASFFIPDNDDLKTSLSKTSLVITPTSTVFLDAMMNGVTSVLFERAIEPNDTNSFPLVLPFDKSDSRISVAYNEDELVDILLKQKKTDSSILNDYIHPNFSIDFLKKLISSYKV